MAHHLGVAVVHDAHDLHQDEAHLALCEALLGEDEVGEVARGDQVHDEHEELGVLEGLGLGLGLG